MNRFLLSLVIAFTTTSTAHAWDFAVSEDPMTDQKVAVLSTTTNSSGMPIGLGMKCWHKGETQLRIIMPIPFDSAKGYKPLVPVSFRVDKNEKLELLMAPSDAMGRLSIVFAQQAGAEDDDFMSLLRQLQKGKKLAVALTSTIHVMQTGDGKDIGRFAKACSISLDEAAGDKSSGKSENTQK